MEVYYYIPNSEVLDAVECGIKLSKWFNKEVEIEGYKRKCISALLNPKDDMESFKMKHLKCLKLEVAANHCFVAEKYFYEIGLNNPGIMDIYIKSIIPVKEYIFGSYRLPECLVTTTVIGGQISVMDKRIDSPVLFSSSEELYVNNIIENYREKHDDFNDTMLYYFYCKLSEARKLNKVEDRERKVAVFFNNTSEKAFVIKVPDIDRY